MAYKALPVNPCDCGPGTNASSCQTQPIAVDITPALDASPGLRDMSNEVYDQIGRRACPKQGQRHHVQALDH